MREKIKSKLAAVNLIPLLVIVIVSIIITLFVKIKYPYINKELMTYTVLIILIILMLIGLFIAQFILNKLSYKRYLKDYSDVRLKDVISQTNKDKVLQKLDEFNFKEDLIQDLMFISGESDKNKLMNSYDERINCMLNQMYSLEGVKEGKYTSDYLTENLLITGNSYNYLDLVNIKNGMPHESKLDVWLNCRISKKLLNEPTEDIIASVTKSLILWS